MSNADAQEIVQANVAQAVQEDVDSQSARDLQEAEGNKITEAAQHDEDEACAVRFQTCI